MTTFYCLDCPIAEYEIGTSVTGLLLNQSGLNNVSWPTIQNPGSTVDVGEGGTVAV